MDHVLNVEQHINYFQIILVEESILHYLIAGHQNQILYIVINVLLDSHIMFGIKNVKNLHKIYIIVADMKQMEINIIVFLALTIINYHHSIPSVLRIVV